MAELYYINIEDPISAEDYQTLLAACASDKGKPYTNSDLRQTEKEPCTGKCWPDS